MQSASQFLITPGIIILESLGMKKMRLCSSEVSY